jgi:hypothetical protein
VNPGRDGERSEPSRPKGIDMLEFIAALATALGSIRPDEERQDLLAFIRGWFRS